MKREDGRAVNELRPVTITPDFTEVPMASVLIKAGKTIVLCTASVENDVPRWMKKPGQKPRGWVTAEYAMMPGSTAPRARRERKSVGGRTQEIQRLIGRSLRAVTDLHALGERIITIDCEVLQADGGTRTASITGGFVALAIAIGKLAQQKEIKKNPLKSSLAAISCGIVKDTALLDLPYVEDAAAQVDMNVIIANKTQLVEVQGTGEESTFSRQQLNDLLDLAEIGVAQLTELQKEALADYPIFNDAFWNS